MTTTNNITVQVGHFYMGYKPVIDQEFGTPTYFVSNRTDRMWFVTAEHNHFIECVDARGNKASFSKNSIVTGELRYRF